ncbi:MAG: hypothetical protein ACOYM2_05980 [Rectinemataceae bacterium]
MRTARLADCWPSIASFEALCTAWKEARRHKRYARSSADFSWNAEAELLRLRDELQTGNYAPGPYRLFSIRQPKPRIIAASPFRDRIVHHALVAAIEPTFEFCFIHDSYATRVGKGSHAIEPSRSPTLSSTTPPNRRTATWQAILVMILQTHRPATPAFPSAT